MTDLKLVVIISFSRFSLNF